MSSLGSRNFMDGKEIFAYESFSVLYDVSSDSYKFKFKHDNKEILEPLEGGVSKQELDATASLLEVKLQQQGIDSKIASIVSKGISRFNLAKPDDTELFAVDTLTDIDKPSLAGKNVCVQAVVSSNTISYNVPSVLSARCISEKEHNCQGVIEIKIEKSDLAKYADSSRRDEFNLAIAKHSFTNKCYLDLKEIETTTLHKTRLRPHVLSLDVVDGKVVDELGREYKHYDVYLINKKIPLEPGSIYEFTGAVIPDPKTQKLTLFVYDARQTKYSDIDIAAIHALQECFANLTVQQRISWILENFKKYSKIINRDNIALACLITFFSVRHFNFDNKMQRGWVISGIIGDSTTAKSETNKQLIRLLKAGQIIAGETSTTSGIAATTTQTANGNWFIDWGPLVLNDLRLLGIDGAHKLRKDEWAMLGEAQRSGIIKITKAARNDAYARTRLILIMNPLSEDRRDTRTVDSFYHPCQTIATIFDKISIARLDLAVFVRSDVKPEDINKLMDESYDVQLQDLSELLKVVWAGKYKVNFTTDAIDTILAKATELYNRFYFAEIPLCSIDMKYKLARISAAIAALTCSFDNEFTVLTITKEHVEYATNFLSEQYQGASLDAAKGDDVDLDIDSDKINAIIFSIKQKTELEDAQIKEILKWVGQQPQFTRDTLKQRFSLPERNTLNPLLAILRNENIIKQYGGFIPTARGILIAKHLAGL